MKKLSYSLLGVMLALLISCSSSGDETSFSIDFEKYTLENGLDVILHTDYSDPIVSVLESLELKNIRFLAVVDEDGRLAGLTGQKGLMEYVADHFPGEVMVQRVGQTPFLHQREGA